MFRTIRHAISRDEAQGAVTVRGAEHFHRWLSAARADVVHMHTFVTGLGVEEIIAARDAGSRIVVTTHASSLGYLCQRGTLMQHGQSLCDGIVDASRCAECVLEDRGAPAAIRSMVASLPAKVSRVTGALPGAMGTALGMTDLIRRNLCRQRAMLHSVEAFVVLTERAAEIVRANGAPPPRSWSTAWAFETASTTTASSCRRDRTLSRESATSVASSM